MLNRLVGVVALGWLAPACEPARASSSAEPRPAVAPAAAPAATAVQAEAPTQRPGADPVAPALRFVGTSYDQEVLIDRLRHGEPTSFKPVGSTSTVFHVRLKGTVDAAFKATTGNRPHGPASEVAAYRLARCLQLDNVPPAVSRELPAATIHALLDPRFERIWPTILERMGVSEDGVVRGAAIYWIPALSDVGVDRQAGLNRAHEWLRTGGDLPDERRGLAASLSTMIAFDYLIGNFDRWSGDNVLGNREATFVYVRDHDQAFPVGMGERLHRRVLDDLLLVERFSRRFDTQLRRFTRASFERELVVIHRGVGEMLGDRAVEPGSDDAAVAAMEADVAQ
jgi:hypothetical protein